MIIETIIFNRLYPVYYRCADPVHNACRTRCLRSHRMRSRLSCAPRWVLGALQATVESMCWNHLLFPCGCWCNQLFQCADILFGICAAFRVANNRFIWIFRLHFIVYHKRYFSPYCKILRTLRTEQLAKRPNRSVPGFSSLKITSPDWAIDMLLALFMNGLQVQFMGFRSMTKLLLDNTGTVRRSFAFIITRVNIGRSSWARMLLHSTMPSSETGSHHNAICG